MVIFISSAGDTPPPPPVTSDGVLFDGNDYFLKASGLTGVANSDKITLAWWCRTTSGGTLYQSGLLSNATSGLAFGISGNKFYYEIREPSGNTVLRGQTAIAINDGNWHCILFSRSNADVFLYDGDTPLVQVNSEPNIPGTSGVIGLVASGTLGLFSNRLGGQLYSGESGPFALIYGTALDLSVEANRRKFLNADGTPASASTVLTTSPVIFMQGNKDAWPSNQGSGGSFTQYGLLDNGTTPILV